MKIKLPCVALESAKEAEFRQYTDGKVGVELTEGLQMFSDNNKFEDMVSFSVSIILGFHFLRLVLTSLLSSRLI